MYTIGIDLGGTNIVSAVVNDEYEIIATSKTKTNSPRSAEEIFDDIAKVTLEAIEKAGLTINDIESVGLGTPGTVNGEGVIEFANNLVFNNVPAKQMLIDRLGIEKVYIENDANCAALGEAYAGVGNGAKDFVAVRFRCYRWRQNRKRCKLCWRRVRTYGNCCRRRTVYLRKKRLLGSLCLCNSSY